MPSVWKWSNTEKVTTLPLVIVCTTHRVLAIGPARQSRRVWLALPTGLHIFLLNLVYLDQFQVNVFVTELCIPVPDNRLSA